MFSGLNNVRIYSLFTPSIYDEDFSLTELEVSDLISVDDLPIVRSWYNNIRVGNSKLYSIYSTLCYISDKRLETHWSNTGSIDLLVDSIGVNRVGVLTDMLINSTYIETSLNQQLDIDELRKSPLDDSRFFSLAIQGGYLTYDEIIDTPADYMAIKRYRVYIPNYELKYTWRDKILYRIGTDTCESLNEVFNIISNTRLFDQKLTGLLSYKLSYFDFNSELYSRAKISAKNQSKFSLVEHPKTERKVYFFSFLSIEKTYHVFMFGMTLALGFKCTSNCEAGNGRYDIGIEAPAFSAVLEFKTAPYVNQLEVYVDIALEQIDEKRYYSRFESTKPIYKIGIACYKKECLVKTKLHK